MKKVQIKGGSKRIKLCIKGSLKREGSRGLPRQGGSKRSNDKNQPAAGKQAAKLSVPGSKAIHEDLKGRFANNGPGSNGE